MFKNLTGDGLGVSARQNEMVELALTYGFKGIDIDVTEMVSRIATFGEDFAKRYISSAQKSAKLKIGSFKLPISILGEDSEFEARLPKLEQAADFAASIEAMRCVTDVPPGSNHHAYHENFELYRTRLGKVAEILGKREIQFGIGMQAAENLRQNYEYQFIFQAEALLTLIKTIGLGNVGLSLDLWNWMVGDGGLDQIDELTAAKVVAVRLSDVPDGADLASLSSKDRLLPGTAEGTLAIKLVEWLETNNYEGPVSATPHSSQFSALTRDAVVQRTSEALDAVLERSGAVEAAPVAAAATEE
ncbi:MAG: TIM barrel protein [Pirellulaceae bacterium]|nr:TIM barrel protein [Pirellulaceae bacterium]